MYTDLFIRALIENSQDIIAVLDSNGTIMFQSPSTERILGYTPEELVGHSVFQYVHPDDLPEVAESFTKILENSRSSVTLQFRFQHKDGNWKYLDVNSKNLLHDPTVKGIVINSRDITDRKKAEEQLGMAVEKEQHFTAMKANFVTIASHEFRTPLSTIISSAEILEHYNDKLSDEKKRIHLAKIQSAAKLISSILEEVLTFSKAEAGQLQSHPVSVNINNFACDLIENMEHRFQSPCTFSFKNFVQERMLSFDKNLMNIILENLIVNSSKFSPSGGTIRFEISRQNSILKFLVADEGIGIPEAELPMVAEPFYRATNVDNIPGVGLGLAITRRLVSVMEGKMIIESTPGAGTVVQISIPLEL
ncbi:MAG TPA: PAS domain-containing sensor histidine kinase [Patescibacteria group bacterium]|nr:PAS domain-containing sensor histidine kinase [Patescibacteria group bacterium]